MYFFPVETSTNISSPASYPEFHVGKNLWKYCSPVMLILGTIGNVFSILILTRKSLRIQATTAVYLVALSLNDLAVLYTGLFRNWIWITFGIDFRHFSEPGCKVHMWMTYNTLDVSAWILVVVTLERVGLVWHPQKIKFRCNKNTAVIVLLSVIGSIMLVNSHVLYGIGNVVKEENNQTVLRLCTFENETYQRFYMQMWHWIDLVKFNAIPFLIIFFGNICIIAKVYKRKLNAKVLPLGTQHFSKANSLTITLIVLNTTFLISSTPISIYLALYDTWSLNATNHTNARLVLAWAIVNLLMYANNTINFFLYCFSGRNFRQEVKRLCRIRWGQFDITSSQT